MYDAFPDLPAIYDSVPAYVARHDVQFYVDEATGVRGTSQRSRHDVVVSHAVSKVERRGADD
jgi:hypothetical protein